MPHPTSHHIFRLRYLPHFKQTLFRIQPLRHVSWKMSSVDQCEIARNSVLQSGFEDAFKRHFLGSSYKRPGALGNDIRMTNVPNIRLLFRSEILTGEMALIWKGSGCAVVVAAEAVAAVVSAVVVVGGLLHLGEAPERHQRSPTLPPRVRHGDSDKFLGNS